jgi:hypothetical protein
MSHIPFHPAPGLGDLLPGEFVVPQNPIRDAGTALVPSAVGLNGGKPYRVAKLGDLMPGKFTVPQNPLITTLMNGYGGAPNGAMKSSCSGTASSSSMSPWLIAGAAALGLYLLAKN